MKKRVFRVFSMLVIAVMLSIGPGYAQQEAGAAAPEAWLAALEQQQEYEQATAALDAGRYRQAIDLFRAVVAANGQRRDAALYWVAYAQSRLGERSAALQTIAQLRSVHPASAWLDDAEYLEVEIRSAAGQAVEPPAGGDDQIRLHALNSLMHVDSDRALPLLERILSGDESVEMKERALFVLIQSDAPGAFDIVADVARTEAGELRLAALQYLGMIDDDRALGVLDEVYRATADREIKEAAIHGFMMAEDNERLLRVAREETDDELRAAAFHALAMNGAGEELWSLYETETSVEARQAILESMYMSDEYDRLIQIARTETEPRLRQGALHALSMMDPGDEATQVELRTVMLDAYRSSADPQTKQSVLHVLWMQEDAGALIELFESEDDVDVRRRIIEALAMMDDNEQAVEFLVGLIER